MERYLLDTTTASYILSGNPPVVRSRWEAVDRRGVCVSILTEAELKFGQRKKLKRLPITEFLESLDVMPFDSEAADAYAQLRFDAGRRGITVADMDLLIAAHAHSLNATLVTGDDDQLRLARWVRITDWRK